MRKPFVCYLLLCIVLTSSGLWAAQENKIVHLTIFLRDGFVISFDNRKKRLDIERSAFDIITYEKVGLKFQQVSKMEWPEITRSTYSIDLINYNISVYSKAKLLLNNQDSTQVVIRYGSLHYKDGSPVDNLYYSEFNRIADRWTSSKIPIERIKKLVLGTTQLMINTSNGKLYPPDYRYDPYTGNSLVKTAIRED
jgi:hypothetical protein